MSAIYFVECDAMIYGRPHAYWAERAAQSNGRESTILDIMAGQLVRVRRIVEVDLDYFDATDVSADIAREIADRLDDKPTEDLCDFLERQLGSDFVESLRLQNLQWWAA